MGGYNHEGGDQRLAPEVELEPILLDLAQMGGRAVLNHQRLVIIIAHESKILISGGIVNTIRARVAFLTTIVYFYIHNKKYVYEEGIYCGTVCNASDWTFFLRQRRYHGREGEACSGGGLHPF